MWKKLLENKKLLILCVVVVLVVVGILIAALTGKDSGKDGKPGINIETGKDKNDDGSKDDADEVYNGDGLEVEDTLDESVYTIDGSGDWDGNSENDDKSNNSSSDDKQSNDKDSDDKQSDDKKDEESDDKKDEESDDKGDLHNDVLEPKDDKVWGDIS